MSAMITYNNLISLCGTQEAAGKFLGVHQVTISRWKRGGVPIGVQFEIEDRTDGKYKADRPWRRKKTWKHAKA